MNAKLLFKIVFLLIVFLLLVLMGMNNRGSVSFSLPPLISKAISQPAAIMYLGFFGVGLLTGAILTAGGGKKGSGESGGSKPSKSAK